MKKLCKKYLLLLALIIQACSFDIDPFCGGDWDGTYDDCFNDYDLENFPLLKEINTQGISYYDSLDIYHQTIGSAKLEFRDDSSFILTFIIKCKSGSMPPVCVNFSNNATAIIVMLEGTYDFSQEITEHLGGGMCGSYNYRQVSGTYTLTVENSNNPEYLDMEFTNEFTGSCSTHSVELVLPIKGGDKVMYHFTDYD